MFSGARCGRKVLVEIQQAERFEGDENGEAFARLSDEMVRWVLEISPYIENGDSVLHSVIAVREAIFCRSGGKG